MVKHCDYTSTGRVVRYTKAIQKRASRKALDGLLSAVDKAEVLTRLRIFWNPDSLLDPKGPRSAMGEASARCLPGGGRRQLTRSNYPSPSNKNKGIQKRASADESYTSAIIPCV